VRDAIRGLFLNGDNPLAPKVRRLVDAGVMTASAGQIAATVYGHGGTDLLDRQLDLLLDGRIMLWRSLSRFTTMVSREAPYRYEIDLVSRIAFRELDYAAQPDGLPLDPAVAARETLPTGPGLDAAFEAEPYDLIAELPKFTWPTVVVSGGRDLVTPPAVAQRVASLLPDAVLLTLPTVAHSALDFREPAALAIARAVCRDDIAALPSQAQALDALPARAPLRLLWKAIDMAVAAEGALPVCQRRRRLSSA